MCFSAIFLEASLKKFGLVFQHCFVCILGSIRSYKDAKSITDTDISALVGKWFTNARDRNGERRARSKTVLERGNGEVEEQESCGHNAFKVFI